MTVQSSELPIHSFISEHLLLSSTLKPKNAQSLAPSAGECIKTEDQRHDVRHSLVTHTDTEPLAFFRPNDDKDTIELSDQEADMIARGSHVSTSISAKRVCVAEEPASSTFTPLPALSTGSNLPAASAPVSHTSDTSSVDTRVFTNPASMSIGDQILQARIRLQIYQREYSHFAESAGRSLSQIQATLSELQTLMAGGAISHGLASSGTSLTTASFNTESFGTGSLSTELPRIVPPDSPTLGTAPRNTQVASISNVSITTRLRALPRKPRGLCFNFTDPEHADLMVTSSLDGSVQLWSKTRQRIHSTMHLPTQLGQSCFVEDMCWDRHDGSVLALALCESSESAVASRCDECQLALLRVSRQESRYAARLVTLRQTAHERSIGVVASWSTKERACRFLTGGKDRRICSWSVSQDTADAVVNELHRQHTSSVQTICPTQDGTVWSGGSDCRLVAWSGEGQRVVKEWRWEHRISHIQAHQTHPALLLVSVMAMSQQLRLVDTRIGQTVHRFGCAETANLSRYVRPSWHPSGDFIAIGTVSPSDSVHTGAISIWDVRMLDRPPHPLRLVNCDERRYVRTEFAPDGRSLVAMSTDASLAFVDFAIQ